MPQAVDQAASQPVPAPGSDDKAKGVNFVYFSPIVRIDPESSVAVWEIRDPDTGEIVRQFPPETTIKAYHRQIAASIPGYPPTEAHHTSKSDV